MRQVQNIYIDWSGDGCVTYMIGRCRRSMLGRRESSQPQTAELHLHRPLTAVTSWPAGRLSPATIAAQSL